MSGARALVLTAGLGTRLQPLTYIRAKAAVPVNGETLARRAVRGLVAQGVTDLILNLHHRPETITGSVGDGSDMGATVRYSWEEPLLGSAGGPRHALPLLVTDNPAPRAPSPESRIREPRAPNPESRFFYIVNGDTLTDVDLGALRARHVESGARVTMALIPNPRPDKYGGVVVDGSGIITGFTRAGATRENYHFVGVQCADPAVFASLEDGVAAESVNSLYRDMLANEPGAIVAFVSDATFQDIGTPADYLRTSLQLAGTEGDRLAGSGNVEIAPSALVLRTAVWDDVVIGAHSRLIDCVIADGARIPAHAQFERRAIVPAGRRTPADGEQVIGELLIAPLD
jgi:NDP-sugar pyrophosphorylase family protein